MARVFALQFMARDGIPFEGHHPTGCHGIL
jgi:hypothetical protein